MITENKIYGNLLNDNHPGEQSLMEMENGLCLPNRAEHSQEKMDYISICARIAVKYIKCLQILQNVAVKHIRHQYSSESCEPTSTVSKPN